MSKFTLTNVLCCLMALLWLPVSAQNLVSNPGFETGSVSPWTGSNRYISSVSPNTGGYCVRLGTSTGASGLVEQTITGLKANTTYTVKTFLRCGGSGISMQLGADGYGGSTTATAVSATNWTQSTLSFTTSSSVTSARIYVSKPSTSTTLGYADDLELIESGSTTIAVTGVSVSPTSATIETGKTQQLSATVSPSDATNKNVSWKSSNTAVATVSSSGLVTAVAAGSATITVTTQDGGKTATSAITVTSATNTGASIAVRALSTDGQANLDVLVNDAVVHTWSNVPTTMTLLSYTHSSSISNANSIKIRFSNDANINGVDRNVRVDYMNLNGTLYQSEAPETYSVGSWRSSDACAGDYKLSESLHCNGYFQYAAAQATNTVTSINDTDLSFTGGWSASSGTGKYLSDDHYSSNTGAYYEYTFRGTKVEIYASKAAHHGRANVSIDGGTAVAVDFWASTRQDETLIWSSPSLTDAIHTIRVTVSGTKNASSTGFTIVADRLDIHTNSSTVPVSGVSVSPTSASIFVNGSQQLAATITPSNATNKNVSWSSSNTAVATVSSSGLVSGKADGTATITVTTQDGSKKASSAITVKTAPVVSGNFSVQGTKIFDPKGNEFIPLGANVMGPRYSWPYGNTILSANDVDLITNKWKFNTLRPAWYPIKKSNANGSPLYTNYNFDDLVNTYTPLGVVIMPEVHGLTGPHFESATTTGVNYSDEIVSLEELKIFWGDLAVKYKDNPYVWFNLMNEPGGSSNSAAYYDKWVTWHRELISLIRSKGNNNIVVVDGMWYGQDAGGTFDSNLITTAKSAILSRGTDIKNGNSNIVFSFHTYSQWGFAESSKVTDYINKVHALGLALLVGEAGAGVEGSGGYGDKDSYRKGSDNGAVAARNSRIGLLAWIWDSKGDDFGLTNTGNFDGRQINSSTNPTNLTWYIGQDLWDYTHAGYGLQSRMGSTEGEASDGLTSDELSSALRIYPNPTSGQLINLQAQERAMATVTLTDMSGKRLMSQSTDADGNLVLDIKHMQKGVYLIRVESATQTQVRRIVVQ